MEVSHLIPIGLLAYMTKDFSNVMSNAATCKVMVPFGKAILVFVKSELSIISSLLSSKPYFFPFLCFPQD